MTKTFEKILEEYGSQEVFGDILDGITNEQIEKKFKNRHVCDDDERFIEYFQRNLELYKWQFNSYLATETMADSVNPLQIIQKNITNSAQNSLLKGGTMSITDTITRALTEQEILDRDTSMSGTNQSSGTSHGEAEFSTTDGNTRTTNMSDTTNSETKDRGLRSDTPQANVSANTSGDLDDPILWNYASELNDGISNSSGTTATSGTVQDAGTNAGTSENDTTTSGSTQVSQTGAEDSQRDRTKNEQETATKLQTNNLTDTETNSGSEEIAGREGYLLSSVLGEWRSFVIQTNALKWLFKQLEVCFMSSLLYGDEEIEF